MLEFMRFEKKYHTATQHIELMKLRGLKIENEPLATLWLQNTGYYRLTGYGLHFRERDTTGKLTEKFICDTRFEDIVELYEFDRQLRLLILDAVERFEVAFRTRLNNSMASTHGSHWFMNDQLFSKKVNPKTGKPFFGHTEFLEAAKKHQQTPFIKKYFETYTDPAYPPCWMLAETITFGTWSRAYGMLANNKDQKPISDAFRISVQEMVSWSQAITDLRNKCAHQSRVWDSRFVSGPRKKGNLKDIVTDNQCLFALLAALVYCLWTVEPETHWLNRLGDLAAKHPIAKLHLMGFPEEWINKLLSLRNSATGMTKFVPVPIAGLEKKED